MNLHDTRSTLRLGVPLAQARSAILLIHGRGSSAEDIAGISSVFNAKDIAFLAPEARNNTWYPERFLAPTDRNEPWLSSALGVLDRLVQEARDAGIPDERVGLVGFSQGACLALEYSVRHPRRHGFVAGLSGALIGPLNTLRSSVDLKGTPMLLGCAEQDAHIPLDHVEHSINVLGGFRADVTRQIFPGSAHTIFPEEVAWLAPRFDDGGAAGRL